MRFNETEFKDRLVKSQDFLKNREVIYNFLEKNFSPIKSVLVLNNLPNPGEILYTVIINGSQIVDFVMSVIDNTFSEIKCYSIQEYLKSVGGNQKAQTEERIRIKVAIDVAKHYN
jgi:hypothetical protein